jgi:hypothetical protein
VTTGEVDAGAGAPSSIKVVIADVVDIALEVLMVVGDATGLLIGAAQLRGLVSVVLAGAVEAFVGIAPLWLIDVPQLTEFSRQSVG